jgi:hypothetical protein
MRWADGSGGDAAAGGECAVLLSDVSTTTYLVILDTG